MKKIYKEIIFSILTFASGGVSLWMWLRTIPHLNSGDFSGYAHFAYPLLLLLCFGVFFTFSGFFLRPALLYPSVLGAILIPYFLLSASLTILGSLVAVCFLGFFSAYRMRNEFFYSLTFNLAKIARPGLTLFFTTISLVAATFYFSAFGGSNAVSALLPKPLFTLTLEKFGGIFAEYTHRSSIDPNATVDDLLFDVARGELSQKKVDINKLPQDEREKLLASLKKEVSAQYGLKLTGKEKVGDVFYVTVTGEIEKLLGPYRIYLPYASAFAFFLAFKTLTLPLYYVVMGINFLLLKILIGSKIIKKEKQTLEVEKLTL